MYDYYLCDWRVQSEIAIPELVAWPGEDRAPEITIRLGKVEPLSADATVLSPFMSVDRDGSVRIDLEDVAAVLVRDGREVIVDAIAEPSSNGVRILILGAALASLCHQRGLFPLHASAVRWGDGAVAFCGDSGVGKSTIAAALRGRGHPILSDDVSALEDRDGQIWLRPAFPRVKLWRDSMALAGLPTDNLEPSGDLKNKYHFRFTDADAFEAGPAPLKAIVFLAASASADPPVLSPLEGHIPRISALNAHVARRGAALAMSRQAELFALSGRIAEIPKIFTLVRSNDMARMPETLAMLEAAI